MPSQDRRWVPRGALLMSLATVGTLVSALTVGVTAPASGVTRPAAQPAVDQAATPPGWLPVDYGNAQISVPASWTLITAGAESCGQSTGVLILGQGTWCPPGIGMTQAANTSIVTLTTTKSSPTIGEPPIIVNGIALQTPGVAPVYVANTLGAELSFSGPPQAGVLHTFTVSPRAIALRSGAATAVPPSWRRITFAGVRFAVPPTWKVTHVTHAPPCGTDIVLPVGGVTLATEPPLPLPCPLPEAEIRPVPQVPGVEVDGFRSPGQSYVTGSGCVGPRVMQGMPICIERSPAFGVLDVQIGSARSGPIILKIGLSTGGTVARTILYSLRH
jgi:hypothetical protein